MPRRDQCAWGGGCDEASGFGRFGNFCEAHADALAAIKLDRGGNAPVVRRRQPDPSVPVCRLDGCERYAQGGTELCYPHRNVPDDVTVAPVPRKCTVPDCGRNARPYGAPVCRSHTVDDLPDELRAEWEQSKKQPGRPVAQAA